MEFDNRRFENRVRTTRENIKGLKKDLNFDETVKDIAKLERVSNNMNLSGITNSLEHISSRFSAMGAIGFTVIQNLTNSAINFGKKLTNSTFGQIISGGKNRALNLEQAQFQIKGLGVDWKKASKEGVSLYDQIDKAVSGTAYGLDAAAKVSGQLLASNIKAGSKDMQNALSGISGVAAMTNSSYEEIGHIFTTIAGNGRVMGEQLTQFATRGLNVASELAKKYKVSEQELRKMVSEGKVDFKTFAEAMNDAFGKQATKANDTYTGALANVRAALSRIGADFQIPYLENMRKTFVATIPVLNGFKKSIEPLVEIATNGMVFFRKEAVKTLSGFAKFNKKGDLVLKGAKKWSKSIKHFTKSLNKKDIEGKTVFDYLKKSYRSVNKIFSTIGKTVSTFIKPMKKAFKDMFPQHTLFASLSKGLSGFSKLINKYSINISKSVKKGGALRKTVRGILALFTMLANAGKIVVGIFSKVVLWFTKLTGVLLKLSSRLGNFLVSVKEYLVDSKALVYNLRPLIDAFSVLKNTIIFITKAFRVSFKTAFEPFAKQIKNSITRGKSFSQIIDSVCKVIVTILVPAIQKVNEFLLKHSFQIINFGKNIGSLFTNIGKWFAELKNKTKDFVSSFGKINNNVFKSFADRFKKSTSPLEAVGKFLASLWSLFKTITSKIGPVLGNLVSLIFDGLSSLVEIIKNCFQSLKSTSFSSLFAGGGVVFLLTRFMKFMENFFNKFGENKNAESIADKIKSLFDPVLDYIEVLKKAKIAEQLKSFATSILEIAVAVLILSSIEPNRLVSALGAVSALMWEMTKVFEVISNTGPKLKLWEKGDTISTSTSLLQMATSVLILAVAMKTLSSAKPEQMMMSLIVVSSMLWELVGVIKVLSNGDKEVAKGASVLISMAIAVRILVKAVKKLGEMNPEQLLQGLLAVSAIMIALAGTLEILTSEKQDSLMKASASILIIAFALRVMAKAVNRFSNIEWETLAKAGVTLGSIVAILLIMNKVTKGSSNIYKMAKAFTVMGGALIIFALGLAAFKLVDWGGMAKAGVSLIGLFTAFEMFKNIKVSAIFKLSSSIKSMGIAFLVLGTGLAVFRLVDWAGMSKAGIALFGLFVAFKMFDEVNASSIVKISTALTIMGGALAALAIGLIIFKAIDIETLIKGLSTIAIVMGILYISAKNMSSMIPVLYSLAGAIALFGLGIALFGTGLVAISLGVTSIIGSLGAITKIVQFTLKTILESVPMIIEIIGATIVGFFNIIRDSASAFGAAVKAVVLEALDVIIKIAPKLGETIGVLLKTILPILAKYTPMIVDTVVTILIGVINALANRIPELIFAVANFLKKLFGAIAEIAKTELNADSLASVILGLTAIATCMFIITKAAQNAQKALVGMVAIIAVMTLMTTMFLLLSSINVVSLIAISAGLSVVLLSISASLAIISLIPFPAILSGILSLGVAVAGIAAILAILGGLSQIPGFNWLLSEGSKTLAIIGKAIGDFVGNIIGGVLGGILNSLPGIADSLSLFMVKLTPFLMGAKLINAESMNGVLQLVGVILALTATELVNGIAGFLTGGSDFTKLGEKLCEFAPYIVSFSSIVAGINPESIKTAAIAAGSLGKLISSMPRSGGVAGWLLGDNDIGEWGPKLVKFGESLVEFSTIVDGKVNANAVENAAKAGRAIAKMANIVPNEGGVVGWFMGDNSLASFGPEMESFGGNLAAFSAAVDGKVSLEAVKTAMNSIKSIIEIADKIPNEGGVVSWFTGDNTLAGFGDSIKGFSDSLVDVDGESLANAANSIKVITEALAGLSTYKTENVTAFKDGLNTLGEAGVEGFVSTFENSGDRASKAANKFLQNIVTGINTYKTVTIISLQGIATAMVIAIIKSLKTYENEFKKQGINYTNELIKAMLDSIRKNTALNDIGMYYVDGIVEGINANKYKAINAAIKIAKDIIKSTNKTLDINSPAKEGVRVGKYWDYGISDGILLYYSLIKNSIKQNSDSLINTTFNLLSALSEIDIDGIEINPKIRPVMDLSNVQNGIGDISNIMSMTRSYSIGASISAYRNGFENGTVSNSTNSYNSDVVEAVEKLESKVSELSKSLSNIKIVMDTGATVGALVSPMDNELGKTATLKERGI